MIKLYIYFLSKTPLPPDYYARFCLNSLQFQYQLEFHGIMLNPPTSADLFTWMWQHQVTIWHDNMIWHDVTTCCVTLYQPCVTPHLLLFAQWSKLVTWVKSIILIGWVIYNVVSVSSFWLIQGNTGSYTPFIQLSKYPAVSLQLRWYQGQKSHHQTVHGGQRSHTRTVSHSSFMTSLRKV